MESGTRRGRSVVASPMPPPDCVYVMNSRARSRPMSESNGRTNSGIRRILHAPQVKTHRIRGWLRGCVSGSDSILIFSNDLTYWRDLHEKDTFDPDSRRITRAGAGQRH